MTELKDLGRRGAECIGCLRLFIGTPAFDAHRTGRHGRDRRCRADVEMLAAGLLHDDRGVWMWAAEVGKPQRTVPARVAGPSRTAGIRNVA